MLLLLQMHSFVSDVLANQIVAMGFLNGVSKPCQLQCGWTLGCTASVSQGQEEMKVSLVDWRTVPSLEEKTVSGFCPRVVPLARFRLSFRCDKLSPGVYQLPAS